MDESIFDSSGPGDTDEPSDFGEPPPPLLETVPEVPVKRRKQTSQKQLDHLSRIRTAAAAARKAGKGKMQKAPDPEEEYEAWLRNHGRYSEVKAERKEREAQEQAEEERKRKEQDEKIEALVQARLAEREAAHKEPTPVVAAPAEVLEEVDLGEFAHLFS